MPQVCVLWSTATQWLLCRILITPEALAIASCRPGEDIAQYWVRPDTSHPNNNSVHMQMTNKGTHCCPQHTAWVVSSGKDGSTAFPEDGIHCFSLDPWGIHWWIPHDLFQHVMCLYLPPYQTTSRYFMLALKQATHSLLWKYLLTPTPTLWP